MAKPRTPSNVLALKGAFAKNPSRGRDRADEPEPVGEIGDAPKHLTSEERACWVELVLLCPVGVLCVNDRPFMEYAARVFASVRAPGPLDLKAGVRFEAIIGRLGMSPADRSKVSVIKKPAAADPYGEF